MDNPRKIPEFAAPLVTRIRVRSREEWIAWAKGRVQAARAWVQSNAETALAIGFVVGVLIVFLISAVVWVAAAALVAFAIVLAIAEPESKRTNGVVEQPNERQNGHSDSL